MVLPRWLGCSSCYWSASPQAAPLPSWPRPRDRSPAFTGADIPHRVAVFADAYGMTARQRAEFAPFAVHLARRYHEDSRASPELDPVYRKLWEDGAKDALPRAEAWLREAAPAIAARLSQPA